MKVLLTGATGYLGRRLVPALINTGHEVGALSSDPANPRLHPAIAQSFPWQPLAGPPAPESLEGIDAVIHLAGESVRGRWSPAKKQAIHDSRVTGTANLVAGLLAADPPPGVLVSGSAMGYYGLETGDALLTENAAPGSDFLARVGIEWEAATAPAAAAGIRVVLLRTSLVLGGEGALPALLPAARFGLSGPIAGGRQWWSWTHEDDVTGLLLHCLENDALTGPLNLAAPEPVRQRDFARSLGRVLRRPAFMPLPGFALRLMIGEFAEGVIRAPRLSAGKALESGYRFKFPELEPALRDLL
ncbi:MAG: TIGR01777 family oxidoreductase [Chloroflexota bacterium]|nr:TIGR01777 family oxidoreductase [Chloroflexota bacterium]MDP6508103.1 TIGR01777 family oxidoreductase [Chloroflexota bacterium]MDP6757170.1 TIGR01777 family oxidoreductase [Chloroflexota bacterium]